MFPQETLPGMAPTAELRLEVLLGPDSEIVAIIVTVRDPAGRLLAQRAFPGDVKRTPAATLDVAWRALLQAIPHETFTREYRDDH